MKRIICILLSLLVIVGVFSSCSGSDNNDEITSSETTGEKSNRKAIDFNETVKAESNYGDVEIALNSVELEDEEILDVSREFGDISEDETILILKFTAKNISYYDEYNKGYVAFDEFIKLISSDGITVEPSSSAGEHGSYSAAAGAFAELDKGEKKSFATEYIIRKDNTEFVFYVGDKYEISVNLNEGKSSENSQKTTNIETTQATKSIVEETYTNAINVTKDDLTGYAGNWVYDGIPLLSEDCEWIDDPINARGTVNQGAVYRKFAKILEGSDFKNKKFFYNYKDFSEFMLGFTPETVDEWVKYGLNAKKFIVSDNQLTAIMKKFKLMKSVEGSYNFKYKKLGKFSVDIPDLTKCAEEMQISEKMLGYVLAMLDEYAAKITFKDNSCHIDYSSFK